MEPYQHPYRSKQRGDVWNEIAVNLSGLDHPKFKVNKRSVKDRLTLMITKHKVKIRHEGNATGITCEETELDQALEETREVGRRQKFRGKEKRKGRRNS